jgi:predicted Zn-dependent protease
MSSAFVLRPGCYQPLPGWRSVAVILLLVLMPRLMSHDDPAEDLVRLDAEISARPDDLALRLRRGEILLEHGNPGFAVVDARRVLVSAPDAVPARSLLARSLLAHGDYAEALTVAQVVLAAEAGHLPMLLVRARCLVALGQAVEALPAFDLVLVGQGGDDPDAWLERARCAAEAGLADEALSGLARGMRRIGAAIALEREALAIELASGREPAALTRLERLGDLPGGWQWLAQRGDLLDHLGRNEEARAEWGRALKALTALPECRRGLPIIATLEQQIRTRLTGSKDTP